MRLVDEVTWLNTIVVQSGQRAHGRVVNRAACAVKLAAATVLERGADLLDVMGGDSDDLQAALAELTDALTRMEHGATADLPVRQRLPPGPSPIAAPEPVSEFITSLDPSFRAQELSFAVSLIVGNIGLTAAAERRSWRERLLGRQPEGLAGTLSAAQERATAHVERHSVWLHNSVRGAVRAGAGGACRETDRGPAFVLGGSRHAVGAALERAEHRAECGSRPARHRAGFIIGAALLAMIGTNTTLLWFLLPLAILLAGVAPAAISFAAGQAAFTLTLVILFNIIQPAGWRIGLLRVEDIALGCAVSLVVGLLFWPRGAGAALRQALAEAYTDSARYLASAVNFGMLHCDGARAAPAAPAARRRTRRAGRRRRPRRRGSPPAGRHIPHLSGRTRCQTYPAS